MGLEGILTMLCLSCRGVWVRKGFTEEGVLKLALKVLKKSSNWMEKHSKQKEKQLQRHRSINMHAVFEKLQLVCYKWKGSK